jgi:hypothetical protein
LRRSRNALAVLRRRPDAGFVELLAWLSTVSLAIEVIAGGASTAFRLFESRRAGRSPFGVVPVVAGADVDPEGRVERKALLISSRTSSFTAEARRRELEQELVVHLQHEPGCPALLTEAP